MYEKNFHTQMEWIKSTSWFTKWKLILLFLPPIIPYLPLNPLAFYILFQLISKLLLTV